eukprot:CAMPEP_0202689758 /NCGR_PEP_ID=MMETSP1385-20130828/4950_1 /ASSEMBLY_ACC=CAM_ASM_000861 /TAXON_ID=933848 /ORGANISM="Elphidium margaritaceum" /LENGTH=154 /DNA_ID=CAMNT_0049344943 /DNA_START=154 /DNA_END=618 /DNA_ORIENTATION=+
MPHDNDKLQDKGLVTITRKGKDGKKQTKNFQFNLAEKRFDNVKWVKKGLRGKWEQTGEKFSIDQMNALFKSIDAFKFKNPVGKTREHVYSQARNAYANDYDYDFGYDYDDDDDGEYGQEEDDLQAQLDDMLDEMFMEGYKKGFGVAQQRRYGLV